MAETPCISSFVIRIIEESNPQSASSTYRGIIRHIQTEQEISFTCWDDGVSFIQQFVPIHQMISPEGRQRILVDTDEIQGS